jgi:hypothetical protein
MPNLTWSQDVAAGATFEPLTGWQYEYSPWGGHIEIVHECEGVGVVCTISSGSDTLQERSPVSVERVAKEGALPSALEQLPVSDDIAAGDRIKIFYENTNAAARYVQGTIVLQPGG